MKTKLILSAVLISAASLISCQNATGSKPKNTQTMDKVNKTEEEWKKILTPEQYYVLRQKGTERPHSSELNDNFAKGTYVCAACGAELFASDQKFDGHCGWPSFDAEMGAGDRIKKVKDFSHGMIRTEIICSACGGHLGHIFDDGPTSTGMRYCVNGLSIKFVKAEDKK